MILKKVLCVLTACMTLLTVTSCGRNVSLPDTPETTSNTVRVTFPEGYTVADIARKLEQNNVCSASDFLEAARDSTYLDDLGLSVSNPSERPFALEGYLFPDTYDFYLNERVGSVIKKFLRNTVNKLDSDILGRCRELGYSVDEMLALASIIQKEGGGGSEMPMISSVLHNRLDSPDFSKLQCDACSFYLRDSVKPYCDESSYEEYLQTYSTYNCTGLPLGPIANPGLAAIKAAVYPEDTDYYFFVTDSDGNYYYSETFAEHQAYCSRFGL